MNVIEKGWYQIYLKDATDPAFLVEAIAEDAARKAEKAQIEAARVAERTASAVGEALANGNVDPALSLRLCWLLQLLLFLQAQQRVVGWVLWSMVVPFLH